MKILIPENNELFRDAAQRFADLWQKITDVMPETITEPEKQGDMIVLGSDADNRFVHDLLVDGTIADLNIRTGSDEYRLLSVRENNRNILLLANGSRRALFYAVYDYFERFADCAYFWDGDRIPRRPENEMPLTGIDVLESPRFQYRGLRYFAHRSLTRFQAEHWNFEDWKKELDWCIKKRLDFFMLRIGIDDLFQRAFPDIVPYPDPEKPLPEALQHSYDDRNLFWSLQYRSELRKKIMDYARFLGLVSPEDCGTMTHWYSRTPYSFLDKVKPDFLPQASNWYAEPTALVWDITQDKYLDMYWKLTETYIKEYGSGEMFHTIGLAERHCYQDERKNHEMKLYAYRRIIAKLRQHYPNAPLLIGTWDFVMRWNPDQVQALLNELDPENTIIFDYISDTYDEVNYFANWGVMNKFPYFFGIFQAFESSTEIRGNYNLIERRLPKAAADPLCKGMVLWPENSHADTLMLEYLAANAWNPSAENVKIDLFLEKFLAKRCGTTPQGNALAEIWRTLLPLIKTDYWRQRSDERWRDLYPSLVFNPIRYKMLYQQSSDEIENCEYQNREMLPVIRRAITAFRLLAALDFESLDDMLLRDVFDLARSACLRIIDFGIFMQQCLMDSWRKHIGDGPGRTQELKDNIDALGKVISGLANLLAAHHDFSLYYSLLELAKTTDVNPNFEYTLKGNAEHWYCRSFIYELFSGCILPEFSAIKKSLFAQLDSDDRSFSGKPACLDEELEKIKKNFYETPLKNFAPDQDTAFRNLRNTLEKLADDSEFLLRNL